MKEVKETRRAPANFRIQKKEDFKKVYRKRYQIEKKGESSIYRKMVHKNLKKKVGKVSRKIALATVEEYKNKGYPENFTNYYTYDKKREKRF
jgi:predicted metal-dependent phosphoesterase TrpH